MSDKQFKGPEELSLFCLRMSLVLKSGILLRDGLESAAREDPALSPSVLALDGGSTFAEALEHAGCFPKYMLSLVEIGESTGRLESALESLNAYYEREQEIRSRLKNSLIYPVVLAVVMLCVIAALFLLVMPVFADVYSQIGGVDTAGVLLGAGRVMGILSCGLLVVLVVFAGYLYLCARSASGYERLNRLLGRLPFFKKAYAVLESGKIAFAMSMLLNSGCDSDETIDRLCSVAGGKALSRAVELVRSGSTLSEAFRRAGVFTGLHSQLLNVGEKTGSLASVAEKLAQIYDDEIAQAFGSALSAIEPAIVASLSIVIGGVLLMVMLPLMGILS